MVTGTAVEIAFARERVRDLWDEILPLIAAHLAERDAAGELPPLDIDTTQFEVLDALGKHRAYTARADGVLVGYASCVVATHPHHRQQLRAVHDALYVRPEHRRGLTGIQLIAYADRQLAAEGVASVMQVAPHDAPLRAALERLGYAPYETTYTKRLHVRERG